MIQQGLYSSPIPNSQIKEGQNTMSYKAITDTLSLGDRIEVYHGGELIDAEGSYIDVQNDMLIWADSTGNIRFQLLGAPLSIRKV